MPSMQFGPVYNNLVLMTYLVPDSEMTLFSSQLQALDYYLENICQIACGLLARGNAWWEALEFRFKELFHQRSGVQVVYYLLLLSNVLLCITVLLSFSLAFYYNS